MRRADLVRALGGMGAIASIAMAQACLKRDVSIEAPTTKISFTTEVPQPAIDKIDLLLMIDNSSSMADKQKILSSAVPDLVRGLVQPHCLAKGTRADTGVLADPLKPDGQQCPAGSEPAFTPITDMHVGIVSSSMGAFGGDLCKPDPTLHVNDQGHLVARAPGDAPFLAWFPDVEANRDADRHPQPSVPALRTIDDFDAAFTSRVASVGQDGCGLEAQLESVYHFLVQPDPWKAIDVDTASGVASYGPPDRVDGDLLAQRAAFLRPDSLVAVVLLTDEDDSSVDPLAGGGHAWIFEDSEPGFRATSACATDPLSPACMSCSCDKTQPACANAIATDPSCTTNAGHYTAAEDDANVRFHHMKQRFGFDPQYPIQRYADAFTQKFVPARAAEHAPNGAYAPKPACTNPLFAAKLPSAPGDELCKLPFGPRTKDLVYFAIIGGVPSTLSLADALDWTKILGRDPSMLDESGMDPHMVQASAPRAGLPAPDSADDADPIHGREWISTGTDATGHPFADLQYACIFPLTATKTCADPTEDTTCDCDGVKDPPLCTPRKSATQGRAKAYPTRRELLVAKELGDHAIVASLCPKQLSDQAADDYGYRPAVRAIADRLAAGLVGSCVPRPLQVGGDGSVPCVVTAILPEDGPDSDCQSKYGLANPQPDVLAQLRDKLAADEGDDARKHPICQIPQLPARDADACRSETSATAFCYAEHDPAARSCGQELVFTKPTARLVGARFGMQCITVSTLE